MKVTSDIEGLSIGSRPLLRPCRRGCFSFLLRVSSFSPLRCTVTLDSQSKMATVLLSSLGNRRATSQLPKRCVKWDNTAAAYRITRKSRRECRPHVLSFSRDAMQSRSRPWSITRGSTDRWWRIHGSATDIPNLSGTRECNRRVGRCFARCSSHALATIPDSSSDLRFPLVRNTFLVWAVEWVERNSFWGDAGR